MQDRSLDILSFSHDPHLAYSREALFRRASYSVIGVDTVELFQTVYRHQRARVVLLCQSLDPDECHRCESYARAHNPDVQIIIMFNQRCKCIPGDGGILLRSASGPAVLLETVRQALEVSAQRCCIERFHSPAPGFMGK